MGDGEGREVPDAPTRCSREPRNSWGGMDAVGRMVPLPRATSSARLRRFPALAPHALVVVWSLVFAALHVYWAVGGRAGLGPDAAEADAALARTPFFIYNLAAAGLALGGAAIAVVLARGRPGWRVAPAPPARRHRCRYGPPGTGRRRTEPVGRQRPGRHVRPADARRPARDRALVPRWWACVHRHGRDAAPVASRCRVHTPCTGLPVVTLWAARRVKGRFSSERARTCAPRGAVQLHPPGPDAVARLTAVDDGTMKAWHHVVGRIEAHAAAGEAPAADGRAGAWPSPHAHASSLWPPTGGSQDLRKGIRAWCNSRRCSGPVFPQARRGVGAGAADLLERHRAEGHGVDEPVNGVTPIAMHPAARRRLRRQRLRSG